MLAVGHHCLIAPRPKLLILTLEPLVAARPRLSAFASTRSPMAPSKVVAEYAKSNRSSCKGCSKNISGGSLRLGSSVRDPRGFDSVKWYHVNCFPTKSHSIAVAEEISGFSKLKDSDKDALRKLEVAEASKKNACIGDSSATEESEVQSSKKPKIDLVSGIVNEEESEKEAEQENSVHGKENCFQMEFHNSNVKDKYKDATLLSNWKAFKTVIFRNREDGLHDSEKIAAFDFDGCLANTSVKRTGADAWSLMYPSIPEKLQDLYNKGYKLVIFTNESNIERWKNKRQQAVDSKIGRLENFIKCVEVPIQVFIACGLGKNKDQSEDPFRKPKPGMWRLFEQHFNSSITIDMDQSFYVGDAAGRAEDHSDADIKFAQAVGLKFYVPEKFFLTN